MNVGPSPSRASVEAGAVTQFCRKKLLPTAKVRRCWEVKLRADRPKELRVVVKAVVSPPRVATSVKRTGVAVGSGGRAALLQAAKVANEGHKQGGGQG